MDNGRKEMMICMMMLIPRCIIVKFNRMIDGRCTMLAFNSTVALKHFLKVRMFQIKGLDYHQHAATFWLSSAVFCPGLKKGTVLLEGKGHFRARNYILRALVCAELHFEGTFVRRIVIRRKK